MKLKVLFLATGSTLPTEMLSEPTMTSSGQNAASQLSSNGSNFDIALVDLGHITQCLCAGMILHKCQNKLSNVIHKTCSSKGTSI